LCLILATVIPVAAQQHTLLTGVEGDTLAILNYSSTSGRMHHVQASGRGIDSVYVLAALDGRSASPETAKTENTPDWLLSLNDNGFKADSSCSLSGRDPFRISQIVNDHNTEIQAIYQKYLKRWPELEGRLTVRIFISPSGAVKKVDLAESTLVLRSFENAVLNAINNWQDFGACPNETTKIFRQQYIFGD
jgi:TonB family protein